MKPEPSHRQHRQATTSNSSIITGGEANYTMESHSIITCTVHNIGYHNKLIIDQTKNPRTCTSILNVKTVILHMPFKQPRCLNGQLIYNNYVHCTCNYTYCSYDYLLKFRSLFSCTVMYKYCM